MLHKLFRYKAAAAGLVLVLLLSLSPLALDWIRPSRGYRKTLAGFIDPRGQAYAAGLAPLPDFRTRNISFVLDF